MTTAFRTRASRPTARARQPRGRRFQGGIQTLYETTELLRLDRVADFENWLARLRAVDTYADQVMVLLREGRKARVLPPKVIMQRVPAQFAAQRVERPEDSPSYSVFANMPEDIPAAERERLQREARKVIADVVLPAYERLGTYFDKQYLPACPDAIAASARRPGRAGK